MVLVSCVDDSVCHCDCLKTSTHEPDYGYSLMDGSCAEKGPETSERLNALYCLLVTPVIKIGSAV